MKIVALDVGGTDIKSLLFDDNGDLLSPQLIKTPTKGAKSATRLLLEQMRQAYEKALEFSGSGSRDVIVGLATPGPATKDGVIGANGTANFPKELYANFPIRAEFEHLIGVPVFYINDGTAAGLGEYAVRFRDEEQSMCLVTLGTGFGGAYVENGRPLIGNLGFGGEFGHIRVAPEQQGFRPNPLCGCGLRACIEAFVSLRGLDQELRPRLQSLEYADHVLRYMPDEDLNRACALLRLAGEGDALAKDLFRYQAQALGSFFIDLANAFDPAFIIIGGGITEGRDTVRSMYLETVKRTFVQGARPEHKEAITIDFAIDGDFAGSRGAALYAKQCIERRMKASTH